jgi:hypothetical protein
VVLHHQFLAVRKKPVSEGLLRCPKSMAEWEGLSPLFGATSRWSESLKAIPTKDFEIGGEGTQFFSFKASTEPTKLLVQNWYSTKKAKPFRNRYPISDCFGTFFW